MNALTKQAAAAAAEPNIATLQNSLYPGAKTESVQMVLDYCRAAGLNPMLKPVHIVPMNVKIAGTSKYEWRDVVMPGIAHYRVQASRSGEYVGKSEPVFGPDIEIDLQGTKMTVPKTCTVTVYRKVGGTQCPFVATELWMENYATAGRDTIAPNTMWRKRPYGQLAKVAEAQALRMAFPELIGGANTAEEMEGKQIENDADLIVTQRQGKVIENHTEEQLNTFSTSKAAVKQKEPVTIDAKAEEEPPEMIDPETGELFSIPEMPSDAENAWEMEGKWLPAWKWFSEQLGSIPGPSKAAFCDAHSDMLAKVAQHPKYGPMLIELLDINGVEL